MAEKNHSKREKFFYLVMLPSMFSVILIMILLSFLGFPVMKTLHQWGSHIPVVKSMLSDTTTKQSQTAQSNDQKQNSNFQALEAQQTANQKKVETLKNDNEQLQKQLEDQQAQKSKDEVQQVAALYANMSASKATAILDNQPLDEAAFTISALDEDQQSAILGSFSDPKKAAQITSLMKEIALNQDEDPVSLKKHIHDLAQKQQASSPSTLVETISAMPPAQSAGIIENLMVTDATEAIYIMKNLNANIRSQVLTEITKSDAKLAARISTYLD